MNLITEKRRALLLLSSLLCAAAVVASPAAAPGAAEPSAVLGTSTPSLIAGPEEQDQLGGVQNAGDVNWDGRDDLLVVAYRFDGVGSEQVSKAYVIFGNGTDASVDLANLGDRGFVIDGPIEPVTSFNAAPGGDINGDGLADIIVGDAFATAAGRTHGGRVFVVFGKTDTDAVDVNTLGQGGYEIIGSQAEAFAISTSNVEDLNADGRDELLINEQGLDRATVLYGKATSSTVDLGSIGAGGYRIAGPASPGLESANRVGDVNGDGIDDLGFSGGCGGGSCSSGRTWVSFGKSDTNPVDLSSLGSGGFVITGNGEAGVEGAGDVNGDGKADIAVSDYNASRAFVAFGRTATSALSFDSLGTAGFRVSSTRYAGPGIKAIGDVDGDGLTDLLTTTTVGVDEFSAAVIFGKADGAAVDAANVLDKGFQIHGGLTGGGAATGTFASAPRIAVAFPDDSPLGRKRAGSVRLIAPPAPSFELPAELVYSAGSDISPVTPTNERRASKMTWSVAPALPEGLELDVQTGAITGTPTAESPTRAYAVRGADRIGIRERVLTIRIDPDAYTTFAPASHETTNERPTFSWQRASAADNSEPVSSYRVLLDGKVIATLPASQCGAEACSIASPVAIADGSHSWRVETAARDGHMRRTPDVLFTVTAPPTARLALTPSAVHTGESVGVDASASSDPNGGITQFEFDLNGDGGYETNSGSNPRRSTAFSAIGDYIVRVRVTDVSGLTAEAIAFVHVTPAPPAGELGVSINGGAVATNDPNVTVSLVWPRLAETALLSNDGGFGAAGGTQSVGLAARVQWRLASSGPERLPKIVYVRFRGGESGRETYTDDIILDERPPQVAAATLVPPSEIRTAIVNAPAATRSVLGVTGKDDNTGIREVIVAKRPGGKVITKKRLARKNVRGRRIAKTKIGLSTGLRRVYVRVTDVAGNKSRWKTVRPRTT